MKSVTRFLAVLPILGLVCLAVLAAPMRPTPTVNVTGTIVEVKWIPEQMKKGLPGASGSLGHDRKFPARFELRLKDADVEIVRSTGNKSWDVPSGKQPEYRLRLNSNNKDLLKAGMKIKVFQYHISGDEGGIWSRHEKIEILSPPENETKK